MTGTHSVVLLAAAIGVVFGLAWSRWRETSRMARSREVGKRAERRALRLLRRSGYRIVDQQPVATVRVEVDGRSQSYQVRGDLLVRRKRRLYLAEIKGGAGVSSVAHRGTRRQLLEYACAFEVDGILLVDMHTGAVRSVTFPQL